MSRAIRAIRASLGGAIRASARGLISAAPGMRTKRISAMVRVKNEQAFLLESVQSIVDLVDEVVIVDNDSTDRTPEVLDGLERAYPLKVRRFRYPHTVARVGEENRTLHTASGGRSPALLSTYYNWCLARCRMSYVLKWDGDMVATPALARQLRAFRDSRWPFLEMYGLNVHPDRVHLVGASPEQRQAIQDRMPAPTTVSNWTGPFTDPERRVFPRLRARYTNEFWWCETLRSPFWWVGACRASEATYLHLKYCKLDPYENFSPAFAALIAEGVVPGPRIDTALLGLIPRGVRRA